MAAKSSTKIPALFFETSTLPRVELVEDAVGNMAVGGRSWGEMLAALEDAVEALVDAYLGLEARVSVLEPGDGGEDTQPHP